MDPFWLPLSVLIFNFCKGESLTWGYNWFFHNHPNRDGLRKQGGYKKNLAVNNKKK